MGISLGLVGLGAFGTVFADLFKQHPLVDRVGLCDREPERIAAFADREDWQDKFSPRDAYNSFDEILTSDLDALVIITQPWLHAPQALAALEAGKDVYSAVPVISIPDPDEILEWCDKLVRCCERTGKHYMLGETTYYRPQTMKARRLAAEGFFGRFIHAEGEYWHDRSDLVGVAKRRMASKAGQEWRVTMQEKYAHCKSTPMTYPTHSCCGPVTIMNAHAVKVTAYPFYDQPTDAGNRDIPEDAKISNVSAFFKMSNGATCRINEFRQIGTAYCREMFNILGTDGSFLGELYNRDGDTNLIMTAKDKTFIDTPGTNFAESGGDSMRDPLPRDVFDAWRETETDSVEYGGHGGSHAYLVHEFVDAVAHGRRPAIHVWEAVRYMAMGIAAHKSALRDGERLDVPDWGDAPA